MTVVTNISDLTLTMRKALLSPSPADCPRNTRDALEVRGLIGYHVGDPGYYGLTDAGRRVRTLLIGDPAPALNEVSDSPPRRPDPCQPLEEQPSTEQPESVYAALHRAMPIVTDVARYVAQLRRWATVDPETDWDRGRISTYAMITEHLEGILGKLTPLLLPEAVRLDAESVRRNAGLLTPPSPAPEA